MAGKRTKRSPTVLKIRQKANFCYYCFRQLVDSASAGESQYINSRTIDHFIPIDRGGINILYNIVICCFRCNQTKANLLPGEFNTFISQLLQRNDHFRYSKQELINIINQVKYIRANYNGNMQKNEPYYLTQLPRKMGILEQLRLKFKNNGFSFSDHQHRQAAQC